MRALQQAAEPFIQDNNPGPDKTLQLQDQGHVFRGLGISLLDVRPTVALSYCLQ